MHCVQLYVSFQTMKSNLSFMSYEEEWFDGAPAFYIRAFPSYDHTRRLVSRTILLYEAL